MTTNNPPATSKAPQDVVSAFVNDTISGAKNLIAHEPSGTYAAIVLSLLLSVYVWYRYGATAGAPLMASFFICVAMVMPTEG